MRSGIEAHILGPLEVLVEGKQVELKGGKQRELLGVLLVHANEIVSVDGLIDALWGAAPPPSAPKSLQALVSRLRADLGVASGELETHGYGYRLRLDAERLDADVFRGRVEDGRRALAAGHAEAAAETLRAALALWRGPALADFRYHDFAQSETERLEELRLAAQEERFAAELELGRHQELVTELSPLVGEHPLRERLRGQLMLALYRSGRQAEALETYDDARRALAGELGLEPGEPLQRLQRQILEHDPSLAAPARPRGLPGKRSSRRPLLVLGVGALVVALAAGAALQQGLGGDREVEAAGALALDPDSGDLVGRLALGTAPSSVAIGGGSAWIVDADDGTITEVDLETRKAVRTFSTGTVPVDIAVQGQTVWIANAPNGGGGFPQSISRLDAESGVVDTTIELPPFPGGQVPNVFAGFSRQLIAATPDAIWVIGGAGNVSRIDPGSNAVVATLPGVRAENIAVGEGRVYVTEASVVAELDPATNAVVRRTELEAEYLAGLAIGAGAVWVADPLGGIVWRIGTGASPSKRSIKLDVWVAGLAFGEGSLWAVNEIGDAVYRVDPRTARSEVVHRVSAPRAVAADDGAVWVTAAAPPSPDRSLPATVCGDVIYEGRGTPDLLLVSDLPLKGDPRASTRPIAQGIELALRQRDFEAGGYTVGYQSCDSATAQAGISDVLRCATNVKAFARNLSVVGVVGAYHSFCSYFQIPIANEAPDGPLAMISPSNTFIGLTVDKKLYPTGTRNYVRIAAAEHLEAVAHAELARSLNRRRVVTLTPSGDEFYTGFARRIEAVATRVGVEVVGEEVYAAEGRSFGALARRVREMKPDAVSVADILRPSSAALIRDLRAALGPKVALIVPDGFLVFGDLTKLAGPATDSLYVTNYGYPNRLLPPRGKQFLEAFARMNDGEQGPDFAAAYGAQAAEILLDAVARSDGSRASVTRELRRTRISNGILGDISFDRNGDLARAPVTAFRVGKSDFVVDRVVIARSALLRKSSGRE